MAQEIVNWVMSVHVFPEFPDGTKGLLTDMTVKRFFTAVETFVPRQTCAFSERLIVHVTLVRFIGV